MDRVFISYRRRDTRREAVLVQTLLESDLADVRVYLDTVDAVPASDWTEALRNEIDRASVVIALIGPDWMSERPQAGTDWVMEELRLALGKQAGRLLPVVVEGAYDQLQQLPGDLARLANIQYLELDTVNWVDQIRKISEWLASELDLQARPRQANWPTPHEVKRRFAPLSSDEVDQMLASGGGDGWRQKRVAVAGHRDVDGHELQKTFEFKDFRQAFYFMTKVAAMAERFNHHPVWTNRWNQVSISQRTWDNGHTITNLDCMLAAEMNLRAAECEGTDSPPWPP